MVLNKTRNIVANLCNFRLTRRSLILTIADIEDHIPILTCHGQTLISRHSVLLQNGHIHSLLLRATQASSTITLQPQAFIPFSNPTHCQRVILQEYLYSYVRISRAISHQEIPPYFVFWSSTLLPPISHPNNHSFIKKKRQPYSLALLAAHLDHALPAPPVLLPPNDINMSKPTQR